VTEPMLGPEECVELADLFDGDRFRSTVEMARHRFGDGRYRYFAQPLPELIQDARVALYERLAPIANRWAELHRERLEREGTRIPAIGAASSS
jgi:hypothetical protein